MRNQFSGTLLVILAVLAVPTGTHAQEWFMNGDELIDLAVDAGSMSVLFADGVDETVARELLDAVGVFDAVTVAERPWLPGKPMRLPVVEPLTPQAALALARQIGLRSEIAAAGPRFWAGDDPYYLTDEILVRWLPGTSLQTIAAIELEHGLVLRESIDYTTNPGRVYALPHGKSLDAMAITREIHDTGLVEFAIPDFSLTRILYGTPPNDPEFSKQWHLHSTGQGGAKVDADVDALEAFNITFGDSSVIVAVVDSGMELGHPDLEILPGTDVLDNDNNPAAEDFLFGLLSENHSTAVGGVATARGNNGQGVVGACPDCPVLPIRFLSDWNIFNPPSVQDEADAFNFAVNNGAAVINNSWGPAAASAPLPASTRAAIDNAAANGRGGLGTLVFFAAGNSNANASGIGYCSYEKTICVAASNDQNKRSSYSNFGAPIDICAPSNGGVTSGIWTTDRLGSIGYSTGNYTGAFGGTSSASPLAAGVAALVISANPSLTWSAVRQILWDTADKIDLAGGTYGPNGKSIYFGYGKVNAFAAVTQAQGGTLTGISLYGSGLAGSGGQVPSIGANSVPFVGNSSFAVTLADAASSAPATLLLGFAPANLPFKGGTLLVDVAGPYLLLGTATSGTGTASVALPIPASPVLVGEVADLQWFVADAAAPVGLSMSEGLEATLQQ
jgi:hypothetical protein